MNKLDEFQRLINRIPKDKLNNVWFIKLRKQDKRPEIPTGACIKWNKDLRLQWYSAKKLLTHHHNIGIYALTGGLCFLDLDSKDGKILASKEFVDKIPETFTVKTRSGGLHYYFWNNGLYDNQTIKENGIEIGEFRADWWFVVSPGSYVPSDTSDGLYRILRDIPIIDVPDISAIQKRAEKKEIQSKEHSEAKNMSFTNYSKDIGNKRKRLVLANKARIKELRDKYKKK